jgi:hypothetical protein
LHRVHRTSAPKFIMISLRPSQLNITDDRRISGFWFNALTNFANHFDNKCLTLYTRLTDTYSVLLFGSFAHKQLVLPVRFAGRSILSLKSLLPILQMSSLISAIAKTQCDAPHHRHTCTAIPSHMAHHHLHTSYHPAITTRNTNTTTPKWPRSIMGLLRTDTTR